MIFFIDEDNLHKIIIPKSSITIFIFKGEGATYFLNKSNIVNNVINA